MAGVRVVPLWLAELLSVLVSPPPMTWDASVRGYPSPSHLLHVGAERDGAPAPQQGPSPASCLTRAGKAQARALVSRVCDGAAPGACFVSIVALPRAGDQVAGAGGWRAVSCSWPCLGRAAGAQLEPGTAWSLVLHAANAGLT